MGTLCQPDGATRPTPESDDALECLVFRLGEDAYGIDFLAVREIRGYEAVMPIQGAPEHLKGVINLRGTLVPVVDPRIRFGLGQARYDHVTDILVIETGTGIGGMVVDNLSEVAEVRPAPAERAGIAGGFVSGIASLEGRLVHIMDIAKVFEGTPSNPPACQVC